MYLKRQERERFRIPSYQGMIILLQKKKLSPQGSFDILVGGHRRSD